MRPLPSSSTPLLQISPDGVRVRPLSAEPSSPPVCGSPPARRGEGSEQHCGEGEPRRSGAVAMRRDGRAAIGGSSG